MPQLENTDRQRIYLPSLEGIRGYAFLVVFFAHYFPFDMPIASSKPWLTPLVLVTKIAWIGVPIFFVLSGYLIGGILYDTRDRVGFFRVFYCRRILRVFPVYYLTLLAIAIWESMHGIPLTLVFFRHFFYIQNLFAGMDNSFAPPFNQTGHFWSLAVEEQFYLLWPLVVWLCRSRRSLLRVTWILIVLCCVVRFSAAWMHLSPQSCYFMTPTRVDAILLGVVLALIRHDRIYKQMEPFAKYVAMAGIAVVMALATMSSIPLGLPFTYTRVAFEIPLVNIVATAIIVAVLEEKSLLNNLCSLRWISWLGSLSYGLYVFHFVYQDWFRDSLAIHLKRHMPGYVATAITIATASCLTLLLAILSYRFIERPAMNLKKRIKYGGPRSPEAPHEPAEPIFAKMES
jgi:peptidoglycan/LPS O-acetylase OafA/YrhL